MGLREIFHRVYELFIVWQLRRQQKNNSEKRTYASAQFDFCKNKQARLPLLEWDQASAIANVAALLGGKWQALGFDWHWNTAINSWNKSPDTLRDWPSVFFGDINYREGNPYGDIRVAWEPSRLQQLVSLALLASEDDLRDEVVRLFEQQLLDWVEKNPPYIGIHYVSVMECALRILSVCHAADLMRPYLKSSTPVWQSILGVVESHADLIVNRLSLYSSAGNHTIAECVGLIYAGLLFPEFKQAKKWQGTGVQLLQKEAARQFYPDGGGVEQAINYHLMITDLCGLAVELMQSKQIPCTELKAIVIKARLFLADFFDENWQLPSIGDSDGGFALSPYLRLSHIKPPLQEPLKTYSDSGYSIVRQNDWAIIFDHGELGMQPSYGHGHSDALSVVLRKARHWFLLDAGTFTYTGDPVLRKYFRGVAAHNTISIDGLDQARQRSSFMWTQPYKATLEHANIDKGEIVLLGSHAGYMEQAGVRHWRGLIIRGETLLVWDCLTGSGEHTCRLTWNLGGDVQEESGGIYRLSHNEEQCLICIDSFQNSELFKGSENPPAGWYSPLYGQKVPITTINAVHSGLLPHEFFSLIKFGDSNKASEINWDDYEQVVENFRRLIYAS
jgi:hypothetical protein